MMSGESSIKPILGSMAENTAMHGLPNVKRSISTARKIFWSIIVLAGVAMILYEVIIATIKYYQYPVQTTISINSAIVHQFPVVTICNQNSIRRSALEDAGSDIYMLLNSTGSRQTGSSIVSLRGNILKYYSQLTPQVRMDIGHQMETMMLDCAYGAMECNTTYFEQFSNYYYGNCYSFNNGLNYGIKTASTVGPDHAFQIVLFIQQDEYISQLSEGAGVRVIVHNRTHMPFPENEGFSAPPGQITYVGLSRREIKRASPPYGDCSENHLTMNSYTDFLTGVDYSKMACKKSCLQYTIIETCSCADTSLVTNSTALNTFFKNIEPCRNLTQDACISTVTQKYYNNELNCSTGCSPECFEVQHERTLSYSLWPGDNALNDTLTLLSENTNAAQLMKNMNDDEKESFLRKNVVKLAVYFESLDYDYIATSSSYSSSDLAASYGGQMGLWLGVSVCTLFEVVEMLWEMGLVISQKMNSRKNKTGNMETTNSDGKKMPSDKAVIVKKDSWTASY